MTMRITTFDELVTAAQQAGPVPIAVVAAHDPEVLKAVDQAQREGMVEATLVGDWPAIEAYAAQTGVDLGGSDHHPRAGCPAGCPPGRAPGPRRARPASWSRARSRPSDLLSAALNRHIGIRGRGLLTHVGIFELPGMDRLIYLSDSGVVVYPDVYQKLEIINNVVAVAHLFGVAEPRVAILAASDTVHPKIPASIDALALAKMAEQGWVEGAVVDGPLGLELAISPAGRRTGGERFAHRRPGRRAHRAQRRGRQHRGQGAALLCPRPHGRPGRRRPGAHHHQLPRRHRRDAVSVAGHGGRAGRSRAGRFRRCSRYQVSALSPDVADTRYQFPNRKEEKA